MDYLIWQIYAKAYDAVLLLLIPYRRLLEMVSTALGGQGEEMFLDAGCGTGNLLLHFSKKSKQARLYGVDYSPAMLSRARKKTGQYRERVGLQQLDLNEKLPFAENYFSGITCVNVLYAVANPTGLLEEFNRVLQEKGRLILVVPLEEPRIIPVVREHVEALRGIYPFFWRLIFAGQLLFILLPSIIFMPVNIYITRNKKYHFYSLKAIQALLEESGFLSFEAERVYGGQNWFVAAEKTRLQAGRTGNGKGCLDA